MLEVWLAVDAGMDATGELALSGTIAQMVAALKQAISEPPTATLSDRIILEEAVKVRVVGANTLDAAKDEVRDLAAENILLCPLTLNLPANLQFPAGGVYQACRDIAGLRRIIGSNWGYLTGEGCFWLPVVLTAKGPLYAEAIALDDSKDPRVSSYYQPLHLSDLQRQSLYHLGYRLLKLLAATPATYLVQFGFKGENICFDRLWPFPAAPALASMGVQSPDLFACHWYCLTNQPLFELTILSNRRSLLVQD